MTNGDLAAGPGLGHWPDERPRLPSRLTGLAAAALLGIFGVVSLFCVGGLLGVLIIVLQQPGALTRLDPTKIMSPEMIFITFFTGFGTFAVLGIALAIGLGWRLRHALALRRPTISAMGFGLFGGLVVGLFPGWIAEQLMRAFPDLANQGALEAIARMLTQGSPLGRALVITTIVIGAPLLEEICFRGLLWNALERVAPGGFGQALAFVVTSLAFVVAHADPIQSPALIPTAFFLGWLRWTSGSLWPCVAAHFVNNLLATVFTLLSTQFDDEVSSSIWLAAIGLSLTLLLVGAAFALRRRPPATPEAAWAATARAVTTAPATR